MTTWHLDRELAERYADGGVTPVLAASVEQHLVACPGCRALVPADEPRLAAVWTEVLERVQTPPVGLLERLLRRVGVGEPTARLVAATPSLRGAWLTGSLVVLLLAVLAAHSSDRGTVVFLALAPVLPLAGVALAFGPRTDPTLDIAAASPYSLVRLLAARTAFVVATTLLPAAAAAQLLPGDRWLTVAWLLPALAMCAVVLALARRVEPVLAAGVLSAGWVTLTVARYAAADPEVSGHFTGGYLTVVQVTSGAVLAGAIWSLATHRLELTPPRRS
jgi:hypothetical protein